MFDKSNDPNRPDRPGSGEMTNLANHHTPNDDIPETETEDMLPADLQPVHQQLVTVGEEWRTHIPSADRLVSYAQTVGAMHIPSVAPLDTAAPSPQAVDTAAGFTASEPRFSYTHRPESRFRLLAAVAASLAVVALLAGVFAMFAPDRFGGKGSTTPTVTLATNTPEPTMRPTIGPVVGQWVAPPQLSNLSNEPLIAPSDPRIIYQGGTQLTRSEDGGATWRVIPTPTFSGGAVRDVTVAPPAISTIDPNTLEISVVVGLSSSDPSLCPAGTQPPTIARDLALTSSPLAYSGTTTSKPASQTSFTPLQPHAPASGFISCQAEYMSRDGGAHWNKAHVPLDSNPPRGPTALQQLPYLQGQGNRLYGVKLQRPPSQTDIYPMGLRIMTTNDATNWQLIDAPLLSQGRYICDIQATPTGSTIFALTFMFKAGCYTGGEGDSQIWRSDDAGAHWRLVGTFSTTAIAVRLLAVTPSDTGDWLLYADALANRQASVHTYVSSDGGATWQQAPTAGLPAESQEYSFVSGTLVDGSIVQAFTKAPVSNLTTLALPMTFYAWRTGDSAWRPVSPPITVQDATGGVGDLFLAIPGAPERRNELWITEFTSHGYTLHRFDV